MPLRRRQPQPRQPDCWRDPAPSPALDAYWKEYRRARGEYDLATRLRRARQYIEAGAAVDEATLLYNLPDTLEERLNALHPDSVRPKVPPEWESYYQKIHEYNREILRYACAPREDSLSL